MHNESSIVNVWYSLVLLWCFGSIIIDYFDHGILNFTPHANQGHKINIIEYKNTSDLIDFLNPKTSAIAVEI